MDSGWLALLPAVPLIHFGEFIEGIDISIMSIPVPGTFGLAKKCPVLGSWFLKIIRFVYFAIEQPMT